MKTIKFGKKVDKKSEVGVTDRAYFADVDWTEAVKIEVNWGGAIRYPLPELERAYYGLGLQTLPSREDQTQDE